MADPAQVLRRDRVVVALLEVETIDSALPLLRDELAHLEGESPGTGRLLLCVRGRLALPEKHVRGQMQSLLRGSARAMDRVALLLVGRPFWVAAARSGLAVFFSDLRRQTAVEVFDEPLAAAGFVAESDANLLTWLTGLVEPAAQPADL